MICIGETMKYKTLKIDADLHKHLKIFCSEQGFKLNKWCERSLKESLLYGKEYAPLKNVAKKMS